MIKIEVKNIFNKNVASDTFDFPDSLSELRCSDRSIQMIYDADLVRNKISFAHTKDRGEVSGTTKKMYRQKGTGGARHGSSRVGQFRGGGVIFGPKFSTRSVKINKKLRVLAALTLLNRHISRNSFFVLDNLETDNKKTKILSQHLSDFLSTNCSDECKSTKSFLARNGCLFVNTDVSHSSNDNFALSSRNLVGLKYISNNVLSLKDLLSHGVIFVTRDALSKIVEHTYQKLYIAK